MPEEAGFPGGATEFPGSPWDGVGIPPPGLCTVTVQHMLNGDTVNGATLSARLVHPNQVAAGEILSLAADRVTTGDAGRGWPPGYAEIQLVQAAQFEVGPGVYDIQVLDPDGTVSVQFRTTIPAQAHADVTSLMP